jgi:hypothetical protein
MTKAAPKKTAPKKTASKTTAPKTPVRRALHEHSALQRSVVDGLGAVKRVDRDYFDAKVRSDFADSLELDEAMRPGRDRENRWDYLLGHARSGEVVAVEPHSAREDQITKVIRKRTAAREQLKGHLRDGARVAKWLWVASGEVQFADTEKTRRQLDQNGIEFVGRRVMAKHLPDSAGSSSTPAERPRRKAKAQALEKPHPRK